MSRSNSKSVYQSRPGDRIRLSGRRVSRSFPVWSQTHEQLRRAAHVIVSPSEEMTIVGRVPYSCSYDWIADRGSPDFGIGRWVMLRDKDFTTSQSALQACVGQSAVVQSKSPGVTRGDIIVITKRYTSHITYVDGMLGDVEVRVVPFMNLEIMVTGPEGYTCVWERILS